MVIEFVERGQIMVYNPATLEFISPVTSISFPFLSHYSIETIIPEDKARKYLYDIISGLEYRSSFPLCTYSISPSPQSRSSRHQAREPPPNQR